MPHLSTSSARVTRGPRPLLNHVIVATDFSGQNQAATERAWMLPLAAGAVLEHVNVDLLAHALVRQRTDLLVIGRPPTRTLPRLLAAHVPTLVVLRRPRERYRRPLVALALDDSGPPTIASCLRILDGDVDPIDVVHALHVPFEGLVSPARGSRCSYRDEIEAAAANTMRRSLARYPHVGWTTHLARGATHGAVVATALALRADLLVVGSRERGRLAGMLAPRLVTSVLAVAPCDLLIAPPQAR